MTALTIDTVAIAAAVNSVREGCATDAGRSAVDAVSITLGHQFDRQDRGGTFNHAAFLNSCGVR